MIIRSPKIASAKISDSSAAEGLVEGIAKEKTVQLKAQGFWLMKRVVPNVTKVTMVIRIEDMGNIPKKLFNLNINRSLNVIYALKNYFERNGLVVDAEVRDVFITNIPKAIVTDQVDEIVNEQVSKNCLASLHFYRNRNTGARINSELTRKLVFEIQSRTNSVLCSDPPLHHHHQRRKCKLKRASSRASLKEKLERRGRARISELLAFSRPDD